MLRNTIPCTLLLALPAALVAQNGSWTNLGAGLPGSLGTPTLQGTPAQYGRMLNLHADQVAVGALTVCLIGTARLDAPVFGGVVVPEPILLLNGTPSPSDRQHYRLLLPDLCLAAPVELFAQVLVLDPGAPQDWAFSNAVGATVRDNIPSDFNGDGFSDLAIGVSGEDVAGVQDAGAVNVVYGASGGLASAGNVLLRRNKDVNGVIAGSLQTGARFGGSLASGDFNGDGYDDLAIGVSEDDRTVFGTVRADAGSVQILYGSAVGLQGGAAGPNDQVLTQGGIVGDTPEQGDRFGNRLATGDYDGDGYDDLAIGAVGEDLVVPFDGAVHLVFGGPSGLGAGMVLGDPFGADSFEQFGRNVLLADLDGDGLDELVVSKPLEGRSGNDRGGVVVFRRDFYGATSTLDVHRDQNFNGTPVQGGADNEVFGASLAAADFSRDGAEDLVVGAPSQTVSGHFEAGGIHLFRFAPGGAVPFADSIWHQDSPGVDGTAQLDEAFGRSLAICDHDLDGLPDLAIGVPEERLLGIVVAGGVNVLRGHVTTGLTASNDALLTYGGLGLGANVTGMDFGAALSGGRFAGTCATQLVIGVPDALVNGVDGGVVAVTGAGLATMQWSQAPLSGVVEAHDGFGRALGGGL